MSVEAAQPVASAPTGEEGHAEYQSLKQASQSSAEAKAHPPEASEDAPASEPEVNQEPVKQEDGETKALRKQRNDERRERRWFEERGAMREQVAQLQRQIEELSSKKEPQEAARLTGEPQIEDYVNSGKYKSAEELWQAFQRDYGKWNRQQWEAEKSQEKHERDSRSIQRDFRRKIAAYGETNENFDDAMDAVTERLDSEARYLSDAIVRSENPGELIDYLASHEAEMDRLASMPQARALMELGKISASLVPSAKPAPEKEEPKDIPPKPPKSVRASGTVPDLITQLRQAADANDFSAFRKAERARKAAG